MFRRHKKCPSKTWTLRRRESFLALLSSREKSSSSSTEPGKPYRWTPSPIPRRLSSTRLVTVIPTLRVGAIRQPLMKCRPPIQVHIFHSFRVLCLSHHTAGAILRMGKAGILRRDRAHRSLTVYYTVYELWGDASSFSESDQYSNNNTLRFRHEVSNAQGGLVCILISLSLSEYPAETSLRVAFVHLVNSWVRFRMKTWSVSSLLCFF